MSRQSKELKCPECKTVHFDSSILLIECTKCGAVVKDELDKCRHPQRSCMYGICGVCGKKVD